MIIDRSILGELVEKDFLNIKEVELFKAVDRWAEIECERQGLVTEDCEKKDPWRTDREGSLFSFDGRKRVYKCCPRL